jgi:hypothetical protein
MRKSVSLLCNLLLSSALFWAVPTVEAEEMISTRVPTDTTAYCHPRFPTMREDGLTMDQPIFDPLSGDLVDFYGPCGYDPVGYDPVGFDEVRVDRRMILRVNFDDGD